MAKNLVLKAEVREHTGSRLAKNVRLTGKIPVIIYGHKQEPMAVILDRHDFVEGVHHGNRLMDIQMGKKTESVIVKDMQYDHLGKDVIHADLMRVDAGERIKVTVPIELKGIAKGTHMGGIVEEHLDHLEVECKVTDIPEAITVWVKELDVGDNLHASDVELPAGIKLLTDASALVASCALVAAAKTQEQMEEEAPVAPEVIGEEKQEEEGQQEQDK